jgi:hypothetical protein
MATFFMYVTAAGSLILAGAPYLPSPATRSRAKEIVAKLRQINILA